MTTISDFTANDIQGAPTALDQYAGQVVMVVNTASQCGFTPQFLGLQDLYDRYRADGFTILAFPCNQFLHQDPGSSSEILNFCTNEYSVRFPIFEKVDVNGPSAHPLYAWLKMQVPGFLGLRAIKWNFTKFLIGRDGRPVARYAPRKTPEAIAPDIEQLLKR